MTKIVNFIGARKKGQEKGKMSVFLGKSGIKSPSYKISKIEWSYVHPNDMEQLLKFSNLYLKPILT